MVKFAFHRDFQIQVLGLLFQDFDFLLLGHAIIKPSYFCDHVLIWFFETIRDYYIDYNVKIEREALRNEIRKAAGAKEIKEKDFEVYVQTYNKILKPITSKPYITEQIVTFCRHQEVRKAALAIPALLDKNKFSDIAETMSKALAVGQATDSLGMQYFKAYQQRIVNRAKFGDARLFPTGITPLDHVIGGGLKPGQLGIWMAPTGRGKSTALVHCGKRTIIYRQNVIYYTFELEEEEVAERYDASFTGIQVDQLFEQETILNQKLKMLDRKMRNNFIIKSYPAKTAGIETIHSHIKQCQSAGFDPDMILIDYLDLMKPPYRRSQKREELSDISEGLKGLLMKLRIPGWTATQSRRAAVAKETHGEDDVAEDWGKIFSADVLITINQTDEEALCNMLRFYLGKNRNGPRAHLINDINIDFSRMVFYIPDREDENAGAANKLPPVKKSPEPARKAKTPPKLLKKTKTPPKIPQRVKMPPKTPPVRPKSSKKVRIKTSNTFKQRIAANG